MTPSKILIVEDEGIVALDLQARLNRLGYHVVGTASSGSEAIALAESWHPALALMDIRLKGDLDGIETAEQIRDRFNTPVIYLTAHADDATLQRAKATNPFGYLVKPFEERELHSTLDMALFKIESERRLERQAAQLQHIVTAIPEGITLLDADHVVVVVNPPAQEFLFALTGAAVGHTIDRLGEYSIDQLTQTDQTKKWREIIVNGSPQRVFEAIAIPLNLDTIAQTSDRSEAQLLLLIRDITAEREIQQQIQLQDRLASLGQLSAGIAHDFNNMLASILLSSDMIRLLDPHLPTKINDRVETITRQAKRGADLVTQILDFSRAVPIQMEPFDLAVLIKEQVAMLERMIPENIRLKLTVPTDPCRIIGDPTRITQVLMNLVLNARDALPTGGLLQVAVSRGSDGEPALKSNEKQNDWVRIQVIDNGTGIHPDVLPHIFEPFFTTKGPDKGTGLGLAQVYGIVQQHSGHIDVVSEPGQGTTFSLHFPATRSDALVHGGSTAAESITERGSQQTILVVEDSPDVRESIVELFQLLNYRVLAAPNGREALEILKKPASHVDLLLSDLMMPVMGGVELLREIRHRGNDVKTFILTGYASDETLTELRALGILGYLKKPVDAEHLATVVEDMLSK